MTGAIGLPHAASTHICRSAACTAGYGGASCKACGAGEYSPGGTSPSNPTPDCQSCGQGFRTLPNDLASCAGGWVGACVGDCEWCECLLFCHCPPSLPAWFGPKVGQEKSGVTPDRTWHAHRWLLLLMHAFAGRCLCEPCPCMGGRMGWPGARPPAEGTAVRAHVCDCRCRKPNTPPPPALSARMHRMQRARPATADRAARPALRAHTVPVATRHQT